MEIPQTDLDRIYDLYESGLFVKAYEALSAFGPAEDLQGTRARLIAARILTQLGADRRARGMFYVTYRKDRTNLEARYFYIRTVFHRRGPLAAWYLIRRSIEFDVASDKTRAEWIGLQAAIVGALRDFERADALIAAAKELTSDHSWILVEECSILQVQDRYEPALAAAQRSLELRPLYAPAVQSAAQLLQILGRDQEARDLLQTASEQLESAYITAQLVTLLIELKDYPAARCMLNRAVKLTVLPDEDYAKWAAANAFEIAYFLGEFEESVSQARTCNHPYFDRLADSIEKAPANAIRKLLPVAFVRQHHMTCVPATLSALSAFWNLPADHLEIAEAICYDGTPWHSERAWANTHGWASREFTVTWESVVALLDRGIPFTISTAGAGYAHLQAVVGYDERQGALLLRDPYIPYVIAALGREMLADLRAYGPRGHAMVPKAFASLLEGVELADTELYDDLHAVQTALAGHRRENAEASLSQMMSCAPNHPITLRARWAIASYDSDTPALLTVIQAVREQFPAEPNAALAELGCLRELGRRDERLALLDNLTKRPLRKSTEDTVATSAAVAAATGMGRLTPIYWQEYARELSEDARNHPRAITLLARAFRYAPTEAANFTTLGSIRWSELRFEEAAELYRFAACLSPYDERGSRSYFTASLWQGTSADAIKFLSNRCARLGDKSSHPGRTLFSALEQLGRHTEAFEVLDKAASIRQDDGELLLFASSAHARYGRFTEAQSLLERAEGGTARGDWLRGKANLAALQNRSAEALALWREIANSEPLAPDAIAETAQLMTQLEDVAAASSFFEDLAKRFPHHAGIHRRWALWLRDKEAVETHIQVLRLLRDINPADSTCHRELAIALARNREFEEALSSARTAVELEPAQYAGHSALGEVLNLSGNHDDARTCFRRALTIHVDDPFSMHRLISLCDNGDEARIALQFIAGEMERQPLFGESITAFRQFARRSLPTPEVEILLKRIHEVRPDLWQSWSALICEMRETDRLDAALQLAEQAAVRFPLHQELWLELAAVHKVQGSYQAEREALEQALKVAPGAGIVLRHLADSWLTSGDSERAIKLMEDAISWDPLDAENHAALTYILWQRNENEEALRRLIHLLQLDPTHEWAWATLPELCAELGRPSEADRAARDLTARRPGDVWVWLTLARILHKAADLEERLNAIDRALDLSPRHHEARDLKAGILSAEQRYSEAEECCRLPGIKDSKLPLILRVRLARIQWARGEQDTAISAMRELLRDEPEYYEGWEQVGRWQHSRRDFGDLVETSQQLVRLRPNQPANWGYLGEALRRCNREAEAVTALQRALEVDPRYSFAPGSLVEIYLAKGDFSAAQTVVDRVSNLRSEGWPINLALAVAVKKNDEAAIRALFEEICTTSGIDESDLREAENDLQREFKVKTLQSVSEALLERPDVHAEVGAIWSRSSVEIGRWKYADRLTTLSKHGELAARAANAWILAMVEKRRLREVRRLVKKNKSWLGNTTLGWGAVAYALLSSNDLHGTLRWTDDWRERDDLKPWMLLNRAAAFRHLRRATEAAEVSHAAMCLDDDNGKISHALWLTLDAQIAKNDEEVEGLRRYLQRANPKSMAPFYQFLLHMTQAIRCVEARNGEDPTAAFSNARRELALARQAFPGFQRSQLSVRTYREVLWTVARRSTVWWASIWATFQPLMM